MNRRVKRPASGEKPPVMPQGLPPEAAVFWRRHAKDLHSRGLLLQRDSAAFERMARLWALLCELDAILLRDGVVIVSATAGLKAHPAVGQRQIAERQFLQHAQAFSLTPSARVRVPESPPEPVGRMRRDRTLESRFFGSEGGDSDGG